MIYSFYFHLLHEAFLDAWEGLGHAIGEAEISFDIIEYERFTESMKSAGWPAAHHSAAYMAAYNPRYRLVMDPDLLN